MPITRLANGKLLYFVHVPKCAGSAVDKYLRDRFGNLGMHDWAYALRSTEGAWTMSPPQHMPESVRAELLPDSLFDAIFATVRHPVLRLRSVFLFQREIEKTLPPTLPFHRWLETVPRSLALSPYEFHGHLRPMVEMVPKTAKVFRIEDGLSPLVAWLDELVGKSFVSRVGDLVGGTNSHQEIAPFNTLAERLPGGAPKLAITPADQARIAEIYAADYERFGYSTTPVETESETS